MRPSASFHKEGIDEDGDHWIYFGELNENNRAHGRGIRILNDGFINIGYFEDGWLSTGSNCITIYDDGDFSVGEYYLKDGEKRERWTKYKTDGTEEEYDLEI